MLFRSVAVRRIQHLVVVARKLRNLPLAQGVGEPCTGQAVCPVQFLAGLRAEDRLRLALTMMRLIQRKTKAALGAEFGKDLDWTYGIPGARLASALREWQVTELPGDYYQMLNASDGDIVTLFKAFGIDVPAKIYTKGDLRELKSAIDPF